jgi:hypothetical protein
VEHAVIGSTRNVSRGGLCATLPEPIAVGSSIEIDLQLLFGGAQRSEPLRLPVRIAWCTEIDDQYQIGVQFLPLHEETAADLLMFLRFLDGSGLPRQSEPAPSIDDRFG